MARKNCVNDPSPEALLGAATGLQLHYRFYFDFYPGEHATASDPWLITAHTIEARVYQQLTPTLQVRVLDDGFEFQGRVYPSLSAVAKAATGSHCNGFHFFKLALNGGKR